jgi:pimeloyl-ACP methyl ester carboxylesterase/DNA-binding beta-propeller fold protein YncE
MNRRRVLGRPSVTSRILVALLAIAVSEGPIDPAGRSTPPVFGPSFDVVTCPRGVVAEPGSVLTCGYLTVLEDRTDPADGTLRLFVTIAEPENGGEPDPIFSPGRELAWAADVRALGYRADRAFISMDQRGAGYSEPSLVCTEIERLTDPALGVHLGTPEMRSRLLGAVVACRGRLSSQGVDLGTYTLDQMAADAEDLRIALGIERWNLLTYGSASAISFEILKAYPDSIRTAVFDSPLPPQIDRFTGAIIGTERSVAQVAEACSRQPHCAAWYPHLRRAWSVALQRLERDPAMIHDEDLDIVVDAATAVRYLRNNLAQGINETSDVSEFPSALYELERDGWLNGGSSGNEVGWAAAPPWHVGYDLQWGDPPSLHLGAGYAFRLSHGTYLSSLCHDEVPFIDEGTLEGVAAGRPWYVDAYVRHPYQAICERWDVGTAAEDPHELPTAETPILMVIGRFDPYSPGGLVRRAVSGLPAAWVVSAPNRSHNALSTDCTIGIRDAFMDAPGAPDRSCLADLRRERVEFVPPTPPTRDPVPGEPIITTVAGDGAFGSAGDDGPAVEAQLAHPVGLAIDPAGRLYVLEFYGSRVRKVDPSGRIATVVGPATGVAPDPPGQAAHVDLRWATAIDVGTDGDLYVGGSDGNNRTIVRIRSSGAVTRIVGTGERGFSGDGGPAIDAETSRIRDLAIDARGDVYFTDQWNNRIRMVDGAGIVTTIAGNGRLGSAGDGGPATDARLDHPFAVAVDAEGNVYVADRSFRIRRIDRRGTIETVAGTGVEGSSGDGGPARQARITPTALWVDAFGRLFISDSACACVRMVSEDGVITRVAGSCIAGSSGDGGPARSARFRSPAGVVVGPDGALYIADIDGHRVRRVELPPASPA